MKKSRIFAVLAAIEMGGLRGTDEQCSFPHIFLQSTQMSIPAYK